MDLKSDKLPTNMSLKATDQKDFNRKVKNIKAEGISETGVIYLGHIPHGFFEEQMKKYFSQFGTVTQLRIARSKRTGRMKGYAFVEFASDAVAKIVAETMNNYLMFHKLLKCEYLPAEKVHPDTFIGADRKFQKPKSHLIAIDRHNSVKSIDKTKNSTRRAIKKNLKTTAKLAELGISYEYAINEKGVNSGEKSLDASVDVGSSDVANNCPSTASTRNKRKRANSVNSPDKTKRSKSTDNTTPAKEKNNASSNVAKSSVKKDKQRSPVSSKKLSSKSPLTGRAIAKPPSAHKAAAPDTPSPKSSAKKNKKGKKL